MSSELLLEDNAPLAWREPGHERFVWRGALAAGMLREFLADVAWGTLDVLLVDLPPGSERLDTLVELVPSLRGALVVTIPSEASYRAVRRAVEAARKGSIPVLGVVENMAGYRCGACAATGRSSRATPASAWRETPGRRSWRACRSTRKLQAAPMPATSPAWPKHSRRSRARSFSRLA